MAEEASRRILETESFERSSTVRFAGAVNNIYQCMNQRLTKYHVEDTITTITKEVTTKVIIIKVKNDYYGKKDWNKNTMGSYRKKDEKKESKDKDVYLTLTKDVKFCCPAGFDMRTYLPVHAK